MDKANGYRPSFKILEECGSSEIEREAFEKAKLQLSKYNFKLDYNMLIYGTSGYEIKKDGSIRVLTINELMKIKIEK